MKTALTIAGSDPSGGAGIQADIKAMTALGVYAMSAVTALTAQNTTGVYGILEVSPEFLEQQLVCVFSDIYPDAVKIGMLPSEACMHTVAGMLREYQARHVILDPVMISTSGHRLMKPSAQEILSRELFPLAELITPNIPEAETLTGHKIATGRDMEVAAEILGSTYGCNVLIKGGHSINDANDYLLAQGKGSWMLGRRIDNPNTHGTGCTLSSAIAAFLARDKDLETAVKEAKKYLSGALEAGLDLGKGSGPLNHAYSIRNE